MVPARTRLIYIGNEYNRHMKPISIHVAEDEYEELKSLAAARREPVAQLIREAMRTFLESERESQSLRGLRAHDSGRLLENWSRDELYDFLHVEDPSAARAL